MICRRFHWIYICVNSESFTQGLAGTTLDHTRAQAVQAWQASDGRSGSHTRGAGLSRAGTRPECVCLQEEYNERGTPGRRESGTPTSGKVQVLPT